nr:unnamed protein product [Callosobruchus analis]
MLDFLNQHPQLYKGKFDNKFTFKEAQQQWTRLAELLNAIPGARKNWIQWRKVCPVTIDVINKFTFAEVLSYRPYFQYNHLIQGVNCNLYIMLISMQRKNEFEEHYNWIQFILWIKVHLICFVQLAVMRLAVK